RCFNTPGEAADLDHKGICLTLQPLRPHCIPGQIIPILSPYDHDKGIPEYHGNINGKRGVLFADLHEILMSRPEIPEELCLNFVLEQQPRMSGTQTRRGSLKHPLEILNSPFPAKYLVERFPVSQGNP